MIIRISLISIILLFNLDYIANCKLLRTNYDIMDSLARSLSVEAIDYSSCSSGDTIRFGDNQHSASWLLDQYLISEAIKRGIVVFDSALIYTGLNVNIIEARTTYTTIPEDDMKISRVVRLNALLTLKDKKGYIKQKPEIIRYYNDTLALEDLSKAGDSPYDFARSEIPPAEPTFWQKALQPAILIVSGAVIVYLLFSVRSK